MKISRNISTAHGDVSSVSEIQYNDNGQTTICVVSKLGDAQHSHTVTVGSEDGRDAVSAMSEDELKSHLQAHLDNIRTHAANILAERVKVRKVVGGLS
jgi:hypothetical protein